jgi:hypothetical protein
VPGGPPAQVFLACFSELPAPKQMTLEADRLGIPPPGAPRGMAVSSLTAEEAPDFFAGFLREGPLRGLALRDLGTEVFARLRMTRHCHRIQARVPDPPTLGYLQAAWGMARWFVERGACAVLDGHALRWTAGDAILRLAPDRPFDLTREIMTVFETEPTPGHGHVAHTRGMVKFGRPDLVIARIERRDEADTAHRRLMSVAHALALGARMRAGETVSIGGGPTLALEEVRAGVNAPDLNLENEALLLGAGGGL